MSPRLPKALLKKFLAQALSLSKKAGQIILKRRISGYGVRRKSDRSFVTDVDLEVERFLRAQIGKLFPAHGIIGEEFPSVNPGADFQWLIDPIDGTLSFSRGVPLYGTIIALHHLGRPVVAVVDHPALNLRYSAALGHGTYCNGMPQFVKAQSLPVKTSVKPREEIIVMGDRAQFVGVGKEAAFDALLREHPRVRIYPDCFGHTLAVSGAVGAMVDFGIHSWDIAATRLLIEEAGGKYVCAQTLKRPGKETLYGIIFGKPKVVDWLLPFFK